MQLTKEVIDYISSINVPKSINSNFLVADLERIIYTATFSKNDYYMSNPLSKDIFLLIQDWNKLPISEDLFFMENIPNIKIINNDTEKYSALMIFPIYLDKKIQRSCYLF